MTMTLQVAYPVSDGATFDYDYYFANHMQIVDAHMGAFIQESFASRGLSGGPDTPTPFFAIASFKFEDEAALNNALAAAGPVLADIPEFTNVQPQMMIGKVG